MKKKKNNTTEISDDSSKEISDLERSRKIQSLREMIDSTEKTIQSAKAMLLQLEGKKKTGRKRKVETIEDGKIIEGTFDGQIMIGTDGKQYPVPANYASKSKLVEGDMLKLTITPDGSFIYKQIGPAERKRAIGIATQDESGNYHILAEGKPYRVLLASITYFRVEPGDEVAIVIPRDIESSWSAIENVIHKARESGKAEGIDSRLGLDLKANIWQDNPSEEEKQIVSDTVEDEWTADIKAIEEEVKKNNIG